MCVVDWSLSLANWDWKVKDIFTPGTLLSEPVLVVIDTRSTDTDRIDKTWTVDRNGIKTYQ